MNKNKFRRIICAGMVLFFLIMGNKAFAAPYDFKAFVPPGLSFISPVGLTVDSEGNIYVSDIDNIKKFSSAGTPITQWGGNGTGDGEFRSAKFMSEDASGNIYVADCNNHRVQVFDSSGEYIKQWGISGTGNGEFNCPMGVLVHSSGDIYVTDRFNHRVQVFSSTVSATGGYLFQWGEYGAPEPDPMMPGEYLTLNEGKFRNTYGIAQDGSGNVYVADYMNTRVQKFDSSGTYITLWETASNPNGIALDSSNNIYITDGGNDRVRKYNASGSSIGEWGSPSEIGDISDGVLDSPSGIFIDTSDNVYVADKYNSRVQKFDTSGTFIEKWGTTGENDGEYNNPKGAVVDASGNIYVSDPGNSRVQKFDSNGTFIKHLDGVTAPLSVSAIKPLVGPGGPVSTFSVTHMAIDFSGNIYTVDSGNHRVLKFNSNGTFVSEWGIQGTGDGQFDQPKGIAINSSGHVYIVDSNNCRVQKFDSNGTFILKFGTGGEMGDLSILSIKPLSEIPDGEFESPYGIGIDSSGNVYVADTSNNRIQKFDSNGNFITKWGTSGDGNGEFDYPEDVNVDSLDNVYVADTSNNRMQVFTTEGVYVAKWGVYGSGEGNFSYPNAIAIDSAGDVYVVGASRVQKFEGMGAAESVPSPPALEVEKQGEVKIKGGSRGFVNPSNGEDMEIDFKPTKPGKVTVRIYTLKGRLLWKQSKTVTDTDTSHISWACQNSRGNVVASGLYIVHVKGPGLDIKKKVAILR